MQSELTVVNNKDICTLINSLDDKNLTCTDLDLLLQTQQFSNSKYYYYTDIIFIYVV